MKIDLKLPGGGELHYEKAPMSDDMRFSIGIGIFFFGFIGFIVLIMWILR